MFFDKGKPITKEICALCKKEIKPGEQMIISLRCPSRERQFINRFLFEPSYYVHIDNAPRYHETCFIKDYNKSKK
jgi:hypothetical protein